MSTAQNDSTGALAESVAVQQQIALRLSSAQDGIDVLHAWETKYEEAVANNTNVSVTALRAASLKAAETLEHIQAVQDLCNRGLEVDKSAMQTICASIEVLKGCGIDTQPLSRTTELLVANQMQLNERWHAMEQIKEYVTGVANSNMTRWAEAAGYSTRAN